MNSNSFPRRIFILLWYLMSIVFSVWTLTRFLFSKFPLESSWSSAYRIPDLLYLRSRNSQNLRINQFQRHLNHIFRNNYGNTPPLVSIFCVSQIFVAVANTWHKLKVEIFIFYSPVQKFQTMVDWLHCFGPEIKRNIIAVEEFSRSCLPCYRQEGSGGKMEYSPPICLSSDLFP